MLAECVEMEIFAIKRKGFSLMYHALWIFSTKYEIPRWAELENEYKRLPGKREHGVS